MNEVSKTQKFKQRVYNLVKDEYTVLGEFTKSLEHIQMKHNKCGCEYSVMPSNFLRGSRCPDCANNKKKTTEKFKEEVYDKVGDEYTVLGEYDTYNKPILIKHNKCGREYKITPGKFLSAGRRCSECNKSKNKDNSKNKRADEFKRKLYNLVGDEYSILGEYSSSDEPILIKHNECGCEYKVIPSNFLLRVRCQECSKREKRKEKTEEFKQKIYNKVGDEYTVLGEYNNDKTPVLIKHNECGCEYEVIPRNFLKGSRCQECSKKKEKKEKTEEFKQKVYDKVEDEYTVLGEYETNNKPILIRHNKCGREYTVTPSNFINQGNRCSKCKISENKDKGKNKRANEFKEKFYKLVRDEYSILGEYNSSNEPILIKHNECGYEYMVTPSKFLRGSRCKKCSEKKNKEKKTEEFKKKVYDKVGEEYTVLGEYTNNKTHLLIKHNKCGYEYLVTPDNFLNQEGRCSDCYGNRKRTTEEFKKEVYNLVKEEYEVLGEYTGNNDPILIRHNKCGYEYKSRRERFLRGGRCPECAKNKQKTTEIFKKEVYDLVKDEYTVLGEYDSARTPILIKHNKCGRKYLVKPNTFLSGHGCSKCYGNEKKTTEIFKKEVYDLVKDEYTVLGEYDNSNKKIKMKHNKCGHEYLVTPNKFIHAGRRCPECAKNKQKTTEIFKKEVYDLVKDEYTVLGEYYNSNKKIKIKHNKCEHEYLVTPNKFINAGRRCPKCNSSQGEIMIINFLNKYNINHKHNKAYGGCSYKGLLKFDFLILNTNNNLILIVEFDGIQHFEPIKVFGGEEGFEETQKRDEIKNDFCKENNIPLLRIPYWEIDNVYKILGKKLYKLGLISDKTV